MIQKFGLLLNSLINTTNKDITSDNYNESNNSGNDNE